jgi:hypothetical protein
MAFLTCHGVEVLRGLSIDWEIDRGQSPVENIGTKLRPSG